MEVNRTQYDLYKRTGLYPYPTSFGELTIDGESVVEWEMSDEERTSVDRQLKAFEDE